MPAFPPPPHRCLTHHSGRACVPWGRVVYRWADLAQELAGAITWCLCIPTPARTNDRPFPGKTFAFYWRLPPALRLNYCRYKLFHLQRTTLHRAHWWCCGRFRRFLQRFAGQFVWLPDVGGFPGYEHRLATHGGLVVRFVFSATTFPHLHTWRTILVRSYLAALYLGHLPLYPLVVHWCRYGMRLPSWLPDTGGRGSGGHLRATRPVTPHSGRWAVPTTDPHCAVIPPPPTTTPSANIGLDAFPSPPSVRMFLDGWTWISWFSR